MIFTGVTVALTVSESVAVAKLLLFVLSVTFTWNESVAVLAGVPVRGPEALSEKPVTGAVSVHV